MMSAFTGVVVFKCHIMEESRRYTMCSTNGSSDIADVSPTLFFVLFQCRRYIMYGKCENCGAKCYGSLYLTGHIRYRAPSSLVIHLIQRTIANQ